MKVSLVIGGSGQLGKALLERLRAESIRAFSTFRNRPSPGALPLDVADGAAVATTLERVRPDTVYLAAGYTHVDGCEDHPDEALKINVLGTQYVAEACAKRGAKLVFFSTDYVFDGAKGPYREDERTHPINVYGKTKLQAEELVATVCPNSLVLRTHGVYGYDTDSANFVMQVLKNLRADVAMRVPKDQYGTPTFAPDLAAAAFELADKDRTGLFHTAGPDYLNRYEFALRIAKGLGLPEKGILPALTAELNQKAKRPLNAGLFSDKALRALSFAFRTPAEGIAVIKDLAAADRPLT